MLSILYPLVILPMVAIPLVVTQEGLLKPSWIFWIYSWIPGLLALIWAHLEKIKISFKIHRYFWTASGGGFCVGAVSFFLDLFLRGEKIPKVEILNIFGYFFLYYLLFLLLFFALFIGGELCWRGYLFEKWKHSLFGRAVALWLLWSLWMIPSTLAVSKNLFLMFFDTLTLMPFLQFFREKTQSIGPGTLFYASLNASFIYLQVLFSLSPSTHHFFIQDLLLLLILGLCFFFCQGRFFFKDKGEKSREKEDL
jgi:hypothetical protein